MTPTFDTQGHRGCRGLLPENTISGMLRALDYGVTTLELDVVITKDKQVILSHEPFFNHEISTKPNGTAITEAEEKQLNIYGMVYDSVQQYNVGLAKHPRFAEQQNLSAHKPKLSALFDAVKWYCKTLNRGLPLFNIETKCQPSTDNIYHPAPAEFVALLMAEINNARMEAYCTIQSFDFRTLKILHQDWPKQSLAMLIEPDDKRNVNSQITDLGFTPQIYSPHYSLVTEQLLQFCAAKNMRVIPWTVNDLPTMLRLKKMGVQGLISDYPNLFKELLP